MIKVLNTPNRFIRLLGPQHPEPGVTYKFNPFLIREGNAWYNPLTGEAIYVDDPVKERLRLVRKWFYVPEDFDAKTAAHIVRQKIFTGRITPVNRGKTNYVVFTTTACNASCVYCFEKGTKVLTMSDETALDVAKYIEKTRQGKINLKWFGGEPLVNTKAIDIITEYITQKQIQFSSEVTTNGDLLDRIPDEKLVNQWKIRTVQLTLDDVGEKYAEYKGLDSGAYDRLYKTVQRITGLGIHVVIRVHYHADHGLTPCFRVVDAFSGMKNVTMYGRIIYKTESPDDYENLLKLEDYMHQKGVYSHGYPKRGNGTHCMGDNDKVACITPDGKLSPCEHYAYGETYGSIYSRNRDGEMLAEWQLREKHLCDCSDCPLYPSCEKLMMCPAEGDCTKGYKEYQIQGIRRALRNSVMKMSVSNTKTIDKAADPQKVCGVC